MKKLAIILVLSLIVLFCSGCCSESESTTQVRTSDGQLQSSSSFADFITIGDSLVYDASTKIVYFQTYTYGQNYVYTPYYATNGMPYKYNVDTNTLEEIR